MSKSKKKHRLYLPPDDPPTVTLGEALATTATSSVCISLTAAIPPRHLICPECGYKQSLTVLPDAKISCPKCTERFFHKHIPQMQEQPVPELPPGPPPPKPKLKGLKRYAKVCHEPLNPKFRMIRFEDDGSEDRLWVHPQTPTLRHVQLIVEPNRDTGQGGWTIVRENPHL